MQKPEHKLAPEFKRLRFEDQLQRSHSCPISLKSSKTLVPFSKITVSDTLKQENDELKLGTCPNKNLRKFGGMCRKVEERVGMCSNV